MSLLETHPLRVPEPSEARVQIGQCFGHVYKGLRQPTGLTCWAAAATSAALTLGAWDPAWDVPGEGDRVKAFAQRYWKSNNYWDRTVLEFGDALDFARINACGKSPFKHLPGPLSQHDVLQALGGGGLVQCVLSGRGSHVVCLWWQCQQANGDLTVCIHDPEDDTWGVDLDFATYAKIAKGYVAAP